MTPILIRPLDSSEWESFRDFRLAALLASPGSFYATFAKEIKLSPDKWRDRIAAPDHQVFGLLDGEKLIGITAVFTDRDDPSGQTAHLAMSFILPPYRGQGLSRKLYDARLTWIIAQPQFKRVTAGHRASNDASRRAMQAQGFVRIGQSSRLWPDGVTEDDVHYELVFSQ